MRLEEYLAEAAAAGVTEFTLTSFVVTWPTVPGASRATTFQITPKEGGKTINLSIFGNNMNTVSVST